MIFNKIIAVIILFVSYALVRNAIKIKGRGRPDLMIEKIRTLGAAALLVLLAMGFLLTKKDFCLLIPYFCK